MRRKGHKRNPNHVFIMTTDASEPRIHQIRLKPWVTRTLIGVLCLVVGLVIGYFAYEEKIWRATMSVSQEKSREVEALKEEVAQLESELLAKTAEYEDKLSKKDEEVLLLSNSLSEKEKELSEAKETLDGQRTPTEFPLSGSASLEERTEGDVMLIFTASEGNTVVATASGVVESIGDDTEFGHVIKINHGNGYVSVYKNAGEATVKQGESVVQGSALFVIGEQNTGLGYQIYFNEELIDPMSILAING